MTANQLEQGETAIIDKIKLQGAARRRFLELGLIPGTEIKCLLKNSHDDLILYRIKNSEYAIRAEDADNIEIKKTFDNK